MIVSMRGRAHSVSPRKLLTAFAFVLAGLIFSFAALTHEGGPAAFFNIEPAVDAIAGTLGFDSADESVLVAAKGEPRSWLKDKDEWTPDHVFGSAWNITYGLLTVLLGVIGAGAALFTAKKYFGDVKAAAPGNERMVEIAEHVREGAMAYLVRQRRIVLPVLIVTAVVVALINIAGAHPLLSIAILFGLATGGGCSFLTGWWGMRTATMASSRTAWACKEGGLNAGLQVAFKAGAVMGLSVVGLGLAFITFWFLVMVGIVDVAGDKTTLNDVANAMITFGLGASLVALFARVGGGIFTKAADVGADLVGKVEAGIPEDDPRNPATIADNVGDNVGDVAGMGADLYESYVGSILAAIALSWSAAFALSKNPFGFAFAPIAIASMGILLSVICTKLVKTKDGATLHELLGALHKGVNIASIGVGAVALPVCIFAFGWTGITMWLSVLVGLGSGLVIAWGSERFTAYDYEPTQSVAKQSATGPATVIIGGLAVGMMSTWIPIVTVAIATLLAFGFGGGFAAPAAGLYSVALAAVGMLSTLGITLATDAYGPIADNAGGNAEMSGLPPEVRERTDALDSLGNTTAAIGKGFAIGSAALTALALIASYQDSLRSLVAAKAESPLDALTTNAAIQNAMSISAPQVIIGLFIGAMLVFVFSALTMSAVGDAAKEMVEEVRRQFRDIPGIMEGTGKPDYASCVDISTSAALKKMLVPSLIAIAGPIVTGVLFGAGAVFGLLAGGLAAGFAMAVMMANAGGAWDNAKKWVEKGGLAEKYIEEGVYNPEVEDAALAPINADQGGPDGSKKKSGSKKSASSKSKATTSKKKSATKKTSAASSKRKAAAKKEEKAIEPSEQEPDPSDEASAKSEAPATGEEAQPEEASEPAEAPKAEENKAEEKRPEPAAATAEPAKKKYKKYVKGSPEHKATVVGDTVGDPFKDTSGPSLNILIKLMSMVAVATVALTMLINDGNGLLPWIFRAIFTQGS
ncbi:MAG: sodium-translocating pyrophosphatase [Planctomycetes bacterium]|nr:sodium-translocating pyrophosphatase [Planctomycetota bacterium]